MTTTARDYLAAVQQRADAAADGPWRASEHVDVYEPGFEVYRAPADGGEFGTDGWVAWADRTAAEFIAASRTDVPRLVAALTAALDLADEYERDDREHLDRHGQHHPVAYHPYPRIRAVITDALTPKENDS